MNEHFLVYNPANRRTSSHHHEHLDVNNNQYPKLSASLASAEAKFPELLAESYPRILKRVELLWGSKEASDYFDSIFLGDSDGREGRQGFPLEILKEIVYLKQVHDFLFPSLSIDPFDPFSGYMSHAPIMDDAEPGSISATTPAKPPPAPSPDQVISANLQAGKKQTEKHINWPLIHTQRELAESAEKWHNGMDNYPAQGKPIEEILMHYGLLDEHALRVIRRMQERTEHQGKSFAQVITDAGIIRHDELTRALCVQAGILMVDIVNITIPFKTLRTIPNPKAREKQVIPAGIYHDTLFLAVADPFQFKDHQSFAALTGLNIVPVFAPRHEIVNRLNMYK